MFAHPRSIAAVAAALALVACDADEEQRDAPTPVDEQGLDPADDDEPELGDEYQGSDEVEEPAAGLESEGLGILIGQTELSVDEAAAAVDDELSARSGELAFDVDHAQAAERAGLELPATRLLAVALPEIEAALLQAEPAMGLDLPTKMLLWDEDGNTRVGVNEPPFLAQRYGLDPRLEPLAALDEAQRALLAATRASGVPAGLNPVNAPDGVGVRDSEDGFDATLERARAAIEDAGLELIAEVDHAAAAALVDEELDANTLLVFGDPAVGTELMTPARTAGIDLPLKLLVYEIGDLTRIAFNEPSYLDERYLLAGVDDVLAGVGDVLDEVVTAAASGG